MVREAVIFEDFTDANDISFFIWHLYPDEAKTRNRCLDTDRFCLQRQSQILLQRFDLREADSFTRAESVLDDSRSYAFLFHIDIDTELEKCLLDEEGLLLDLIGGDRILMFDLIQEFDTRIVPCAKIERLCRDF